MGKISDALERQKRDTKIKSQMLLRNQPKEKQTKKLSSAIVREFSTQQTFNHKLIVCSSPGSVEAENFKVLRSQILFPKDSERKRVILVTSCFPSEGKTFIAANLAASIAQGINEHVLLIDCDFRRPHLHNLLGLSNKKGLHEYLTGKKQLSDLLVKTGIDKLSFLPAGSSSENPSELLGSDEMKNFFREAKDRYKDRFIIVDATPLEVTSEAAVLANHVEGIVFVVMSRKTSRDVIKKNIENIGKEKILGVVFNGYEQKLKGYGKYYKKYYK